MFEARFIPPTNNHPRFPRFIPLIAAILLIAPFSFLPNAVYQVRQIADINQTETAGSYPSHPVELAGKLFFSADDGIHGVELWSSTGRADGTAMLLDIVPGAESGYPDHLTVLNQTLFFTTHDLAGTTNLWKSDGTTAGTLSVQQFADITSLTVIGETLYLRNDEGLWVTDETTAEIMLLQQLPGSAFPPVEVGGAVYFLVSEFGAALFTTDGTPAGTHFVRTIVNGPRSWVTQQLVANDTIFFVSISLDALPTPHVTESALWKSDGTADGTERFKSFLPTTNTRMQALIGPVVTVGSSLYFAADDSEHGSELWKSDGTAEGTTLVADIVPGIQGAAVQQLAAVGDMLYFAADDGLHGSELWKSKGTAESTVLVADIAAGAEGSALEQITPAPVAGQIIFIASDGRVGTQLWMSDGTGAGTLRVGALTPGTSTLVPAWIDRGLGRIIGMANDGQTGWELWSLTAWRLVEW